MIGQIRFSGESILALHGNEEKLAVINHCFDNAMLPLAPISDDLHLPKPVLEFLAVLKPNSKGLCDRNGTLYVEMNSAVLQSTTALDVFLTFYREVLNQFPGLKPYCALFEKTVTRSHDSVKYPVPIERALSKMTQEEYVRSYKEWVAKNPEVLTTNIYVTVRVLDMLLEKLVYHFTPESDFPIPDAIQFCQDHGLSNGQLIAEFKIPETSFYRLKKSATPKMAVAKEAVKDPEKLTENMSFNTANLAPTT